MSSFNELHQAGQSVWLDFIRRDMLGNGELEALVDEGIRGLTSNPSIFQQAIAGSDLYDRQIAAMGTASSHIAFETLAVADIQDAADVLRPVYSTSDGADGFVSLEVSPHLAHDTAGTIADANRLWTLVDRPNLMIKVPATEAGTPALEHLVAEGINVNATLMFSLEHYEDIAQAYVRGVEQAAEPASVASVASFFVSRVDTKADAALEKVGSPEALGLRGKVAVANAKLAYRRYQQIFEGGRFAEAKSRGARPQRPLWASTSTKNPEYSDVLYVDELVGSNTVNTMPPATIDAFRDHGRVDMSALTTDVDQASADIEALAGMGISYRDLTEQLQTEGVAAFSESFDDLLDAIADKQAALS